MPVSGKNPSLCSNTRPVSAWRLHQKIGLRGDLLAVATGAELGRKINAKRAAKLNQTHSEIMQRILPHVDALPDAIELLRELVFEVEAEVARGEHTKDGAFANVDAAGNTVRF